MTQIRRLALSAAHRAIELARAERTDDLIALELEALRALARLLWAPHEIPWCIPGSPRGLVIQRLELLNGPGFEPTYGAGLTYTDEIVGEMEAR